MHTRPRSCWPVSSTVPGRCIPIQGPAGQFLQRYQDDAYLSKLPACYHDRLKPCLGLIPGGSAAFPVRGRPLDTGPESRLCRPSLEPFFLARLPAFLLAKAGQRWHQSLGGGPVAANLSTRNVIMARLYIYRNLQRIC
jgi:hypothetical protein